MVFASRHPGIILSLYAAEQELAPCSRDGASGTAWRERGYVGLIFWGSVRPWTTNFGGFVSAIPRLVPAHSWVESIGSNAAYVVHCVLYVVCVHYCHYIQLLVMFTLVIYEIRLACSALFTIIWKLIINIHMFITLCSALSSCVPRAGYLYTSQRQDWDKLSFS